jgi:phage anti-repressor protein
MHVREYIKKTTSIPNRFIDELFALYGEDTLQTDFVIILDHVVKWLDTRKDRLVETLRRSYKEHIDFIVQKSDAPKKDPRNNNQKLYLLTPDCFKRLAMVSKSKNADTVRSYFIEVEGLYIKYRRYIIEGMENDIKKMAHNQNPNKYKKLKGGFIYIIKVGDRDGMYKVGRTTDIHKRMKVYQTGLADDVDVLFVYETEDLKRTESCVKNWLTAYQYRGKKEVYEIDIDTLKEVIVGCQRIGAKLAYKKQTGGVDGTYLILTQEKIDA